MTTEKRYNNYTISILVSSLVGVALIIPALLMHSLSIGTLPDWLFDLISAVFGIMFVSRLVSGSSYVFRLLDRLTENTIIDVILCKFKKNKLDLENENKQREKLLHKATTEAKKRIGQTTGNALGFIIATAFAITTLCLKAATPTIINAFFSSSFYLVNHISNFSGLFNRSGSAIDLLLGKSDKPWYRRKEINYVLGVIFGGIAGLALVSVILFVVGVTSAMSLGGAVPMWLSLGLLVIGTLSTGASAGGYIGRCIDFLIGERTVVNAVADINNVEAPKETIKERTCCESTGTVIGVTLGITLATILIVAGVASLPFFGLGLPKLFAGMILMATCLSVCGGLGNRLGSAIDNFFLKGRYEHKEESGKEEITDDHKKRLNPNNPHEPSPITALAIPKFMQVGHTSSEEARISQSPIIESKINGMHSPEVKKNQMKLPQPLATQITPNLAKKDEEPPINLINSKSEKANTSDLSVTRPLLFKNTLNKNTETVKENISFAEHQQRKLNGVSTQVSAKQIIDFSLFNKTTNPRSFLPTINNQTCDEMQSNRFACAAAAA